MNWRGWVKRDSGPTSLTIVAALICRMPRRHCSAAMMARSAWGAAAIAQPDELPVEHIAARPGLVTRARPLARTQLAHQFRDGVGAVGDDAQNPDFPVGFGDGGRDGFGVDIQAQVPQVVGHRPAPFACSSAWFGSSDRVTYALRSRAGHSILTSRTTDLTIRRRDCSAAVVGTRS